MLLAFGTASSESAYPKLLQQLERFGCDEKVCGLVLPLGYSFNLDGSMMYMTFAVLFIAQAYGIDMPLSRSAHHAAGLAVHQQGRGRRTQSLADSHRGNPVDVSYSRSRFAAVAGY